MDFHYGFRCATIKYLIVLLNILYYVHVAVIMALYGAHIWSSDTVYMITSFITSGFAILLAVLFLIYGLSVYSIYNASSDSESEETIKEGKKKVSWVVAVCFLTFMFRAALSIVNALQDLNWYFLVLYFIISEIVPSTLMIAILRHSEKPVAKTAYAVRNLYSPEPRPYSRLARYASTYTRVRTPSKAIAKQPQLLPRPSISNGNNNNNNNNNNNLVDANHGANHHHNNNNNNQADVHGKSPGSIVINVT